MTSFGDVFVVPSILDVLTRVELPLPSVDPDLVDRIYEAGVLPELWPDVLQALCGLGQGYGAALLALEVPSRLVSPPERFRFITTPAYEAAYRAYSEEGRAYNNVRPERALKQNHAGFQTDLELCTPEELAADPIYSKFLYPYGIGWTSGTSIAIPESHVLVFDVCRRLGDAPFERADMERLNPYRPHLARAALLSARLAFERRQAQVDVLGAIGLPAAIISQSGRVIAANASFDGLDPQMAIGTFDRVTLAYKPAEDLLRTVLGAAGPNDDVPVRSIAVPASEGRDGLVLHLVPLRGEARDIFSGAAAILIATAVAAPQLPFADLLSGLFDLTPAEARLARAVAGGMTLQDYSTRTQISAETARTQLKAVMHKTGTHRQLDLVRLLMTATPLRVQT